ncbi:hypothetical protein DFH08DRAFT_251415 [Mycena albidolilacea]|uniref:Uncharacterized protein n=1 Tax=Mycena albidolilacea TaxID=1033008 RepID=A0AAD6ZTV6_9AGAR|nr:hypothetical protein DFH08DRAFT_251415 [Mycena albidolilacea]
MHLPRNRSRSRSCTPHPVSRMHTQSPTVLDVGSISLLDRRIRIRSGFTGLGLILVGRWLRREDRSSGGAYFLESLTSLFSHSSLSHSARAPSRPLRPSAPSPSRRRSRWRVKAECIGGAGCIHAGGHAPPSLPPPSSRVPSDCAGCLVSASLRRLPIYRPNSKFDLFFLLHFLYRCLCTPFVLIAVQMMIPFLPNAFSFVIIFLPTFFCLFPDSASKRPSAFGINTYK